MICQPVDALRTKSSLFDVGDKSCSNARQATILPLSHMLRCHVRREYSVVVKPGLVFSYSVVLAFWSSSDAVGAVCLHLTAVAMRFGSWRDLCQIPEVSCMPGTDTTRNQYLFLNMPALQSLSSTLLAKPFAGGITYDQPNAWPYMRSKHWLPSIVASVPFRAYLHPCMYLLSCVNWMDENTHSVHKAHNQLNCKCPSMANARRIALRN
jgi:hypothetical protein